MLDWFESPGKSRFLVVVFFILIIYGCEERNRTNPLDPLNPETSGKPAGVRVYSLEQEVIITWDAIQVDGFRGMRIFRSTNQNGSYQEIAFVKEPLTKFEDRLVVYDTSYSYQIRAETETFHGPFSESLRITPGPSYIWVSLSSSGEVVKLTHDASQVIFSQQELLSPLGLVSVGYNKGVWITDFYQSEIVRITDSGSSIFHIGGFLSPIDIDYDPIRNRLWVVDRDRAQVALLDTSGTSYGFATGFLFPVAGSVDPTDGDFWVADPSLGIIGRTDPKTMGVARISNFYAPADVKTVHKDGGCWIADNSRIVRLDALGNLLFSVPGFQQATHVAVNQETRECWVVDDESESNLSKIVKVSAQGNVLFDVPGFNNPYSLDVDEYDGSCVVADTWNYRIVKISATGNVIGEWLAPAPPRTVRVVSK